MKFRNREPPLVNVHLNWRLFSSLYLCRDRRQDWNDFVVRRNHIEGQRWLSEGRSWHRQAHRLWWFIEGWVLSSSDLHFEFKRFHPIHTQNCLKLHQKNKSRIKSVNSKFNINNPYIRIRLENIEPFGCYRTAIAGYRQWRSHESRWRRCGSWWSGRDGLSGSMRF